MSKAWTLVEIIDDFEDMCYSLYDSINEGKPSFVIRYSAIKAALEIMAKEPSDWPKVDALFQQYLVNERTRLEARLTIKTIQVD